MLLGKCLFFVQGLPNREIPFKAFRHKHLTGQICKQRWWVCFSWWSFNNWIQTLTMKLWSQEWNALSSDDQWPHCYILKNCFYKHQLYLCRVWLNIVTIMKHAHPRAKWFDNPVSDARASSMTCLFKWVLRVMMKIALYCLLTLQHVCFAIVT